MAADEDGGAGALLVLVRRIAIGLIVLGAALTLGGVIAGVAIALS